MRWSETFFFLFLPSFNFLTTYSKPHFWKWCEAMMDKFLHETQNHSLNINKMYIHSSSQDTVVYETPLESLATTLLSIELQQLNGKILWAAKSLNISLEQELGVVFFPSISRVFINPRLVCCAITARYDHKNKVNCPLCYWLITMSTCTLHAHSHFIYLKNTYI